MEIAQFRYANDNLGYLIYGKENAVAVDGGNPSDMIAFAREKGCKITQVTNTHSHPDHTLGNSELLEKTSARYLDPRNFVHDARIEIEPGAGLTVLRTPGHTLDSVCFRGDGFVVTGDTLFNATVGNCFSGDLRAYYRSLKLLMALPGETLIYAGHDYLVESLAAAWSIEKDNPDIKAYEEKYAKGPVVVSTLWDELKVNPYLRFNAPSVILRLGQRNMPRETEEERFSSLMEIF